MSRKALPDKQPNFKLNNGQEIPALALGEGVSTIAVYTSKNRAPAGCQCHRGLCCAGTWKAEVSMHVIILMKCIRKRPSHLSQLTLLTQGSP